LTPQN